MKDVKKFAESLIYSNQISYGKNFVFDPDRAIFDDRSQKIAELIKAKHSTY